MDSGNADWKGPPEAIWSSLNIPSHNSHLLLYYLMLLKVREEEQQFSYNATSPWSNGITAQPLAVRL